MRRSSRMLVTGFLLAVMAWLETPMDIESTVSASVLLNASRKNLAFHMLVWMLVFGVPAGIGFAVTDGAAHFMEPPVRGSWAGLPSVSRRLSETASAMG